MPIDKNPCFSCTKRNVGCHAACTEYKAWAGARDQARAEREKQMTRELGAYKNASITKHLRRKHQGGK